MQKSYLPTDIIPHRDNEHGAHDSAEDLETDKPRNLARTFVHSAKDSTSRRRAPGRLA